MGDFTYHDDWMLRAKCGNDTNLLNQLLETKHDIFFDDNRDGIAKKYCLGKLRDSPEVCPVVAECQAHAMQNHEWGIWGATSQKARTHRERKSRKEFLVLQERLKELLPDAEHPNAS